MVWAQCFPQSQEKNIRGIWEGMAAAPHCVFLSCSCGPTEAGVSNPTLNVNMAKHNTRKPDGDYLKAKGYVHGHWHLCMLRDATGSETTSGAAVGLRLESEEWRGSIKVSWSWGKQQKEDSESLWWKLGNLSGICMCPHMANFLWSH